MYAGHATPEVLDEWLNVGVEVSCPGLVKVLSSYVYIEIDYSGFDGTYSAPAIRTIVEKWYVLLRGGQKFSREVTEVFKYWRDPNAESRLGTKFSRENVNASGRDDTALLNASTNGLVLALVYTSILTETAIELITPSQLVATMNLIRLIVLGDDSLVHLPNKTFYGNEYTIESINSSIGRFGFSAKTKLHTSLPDVTFLGRRPYVGADHKLVWARTLGRAGFKHGWARVNDLTPCEWIRAIAESTVINDGVVPVLSDMARKELELIGPGKSAKTFEGPWIQRSKPLEGCVKCNEALVATCMTLVGGTCWKFVA